MFKPPRTFWLLLSLAVALTAAYLFAATMARAAGCHRYSIWKYPQPQRCSVVRVADDKPLPPTKPKDLPRFVVSDWDTIILHLPPGTSDEDGRAAAIEVLKEVMGK